LDIGRELILSSEQVYRGRALGLRADTVEKTNGKRTTREVVEHGDCVVIVAIDDADNILLVRQFRYAVGRDLLELPAGGIEPGETPDQAVRRELQEETGYLPKRIESLGGFYAAPGYCTEYLYLYLATDLVYSPLHAEDTDGIELVRVPSVGVRGLITEGKICDAKSIAGLLSLSWNR